MITSIPQKRCYRCKQEFPLESFPNNKAKFDGKTSECRGCKKTIDKNRSGRTITKAMRLVGFTTQDFQEIWNSQGGKCAICQKPETSTNQWGAKKLAVDHDHLTGKFRGLLCQLCNTRLAVLEDKDFVDKATKYLEHIVTPACL